MSELSQLQCVPCRGDSPPLADEEIARLLPQVPDWTIIEQEGVKRLERVFRLDNFAEALALTNKIGALAEAEGHHPLIVTEWGRVTVQWWTHTIAGLHQNDFILAARTDALI